MGINRYYIVDIVLIAAHSRLYTIQHMQMSYMNNEHFFFMFYFQVPFGSHCLFAYLDACARL